jgi:hypothetical protein
MAGKLPRCQRRVRRCSRPNQHHARLVRVQRPRVAAAHALAAAQTLAPANASRVKATQSTVARHELSTKQEGVGAVIAAQGACL